jgi:outer membrane protein assembly factor BamB
VNWRVLDRQTGGSLGTDTNRPPDGDSLSTATFVEGRVYLGLGTTIFAGVPYTFEYANGCCGYEISVEWWVENLPSEILGVTSVGSDVVVAMTSSHVHAFNRETGGERWRAPIEPASEAIVGSDTVYVATMERAVVALDLATGQERWRVDGGEDDFYARLILSGETLYWRADGRILAIDAQSGDVRWESEAVLGRVSDWFLASDTIYTGVDQHLVAFDAANGEQRWSVEISPEAERFLPTWANEGVIYGVALTGEEYTALLFAVAGEGATTPSCRRPPRRCQ